ncbi:MAG TPA: hypothetical protein VK458_04895, partial [Myxococcaceae bacterium]|nr:hypothetical protein [Myxococcaceae bacterium]
MHTGRECRLRAGAERSSAVPLHERHRGSASHGYRGGHVSAHPDPGTDGKHLERYAHGDGCSANCRLSVCGDGMVSGSEVCDDGNTITESACPYGTPSCMNCNATCTAVLGLTGPYCGDGLTSSGEVCDDGNTSACGTCGAMCQQTQLARATGAITAVGGASLVDGERFTLGDGINPPLEFEFDKNGSSSSTSIRVAITNADTAGTVATAIAFAINSA